MTTGNRKLKSFVSRLLELSKTDGIVDAKKVESVLATLRGSDVRSLRQVLRLYRTVIKMDLRHSSANVTFAGELGDSVKADLEKTLEGLADRNLTFSYNEDPELIAGIKIAVGDYVFNHSIQDSLKRLSQTH